ncbi:cytochrome P450 [Actinoallomurus soli]|uniref:cytochrome P450 n=1 Tax=Actinoallomurus soli TaxID=2952535 RepID=UPI002092E4FD|nr:cytochrome P450 [Actinoallomurus soli]MCO5972774.1 cytochrome P450 [Actinoallomurus soli]
MTTTQSPPRAQAPPRRASVLDTLRIGAVVLAPTIARGVLARRPRIVAMADALDADRRAARLLRRMRARYGPGPLLLRIPGRSIALVLSAGDVRRVLTGSPEPFAAANREKRAALARFQPHGVLISTGADRADRRRFNEAVLDTARPVHRMADAITRKIQEEAGDLLAAADADGTLTWDGFRRTWWRLVRRIVLGDAARDDSELTDLLTRLRMDANWSFFHPGRRIVRERFQRRLREHLRREEPGSLAALVGGMPTTPRTEPADQVPQWLFAFEPAGMAVFRTLAVLAGHPEQAARARAEIDGRDLSRPQDLPYLRACVEESVRLWPTTLAILRDTTTETDWGGTTLPAGTALAILTAFVQRDDETLPFADRFVPEIWLDGTAKENWSVVPFSGGPVECPGRNLVELVAGTFLAVLLEDHDHRLASRRPLTPDRPLPRTLNPFDLRFDVRRRNAERIS